MYLCNFFLKLHDLNKIQIRIELVSKIDKIDLIHHILQAHRPTKLFENQNILKILTHTIQKVFIKPVGQLEIHREPLFFSDDYQVLRI